MYKSYLIFLWILLLLAGCASPPVSTSLPASQTPVLTATNTPAITSTLILAITVTPEIRFTHQCLSADEHEVELKDVSSGTIFIQKSNHSLDGRHVLINLQTGKEYKLPPNVHRPNFINSEISPDRKMLAELESAYDKMVLNGGQIGSILWVFDARANVIGRIDFDRTDLFSLYWLDNEWLILYTEEYGKLLLINPFTEEQRLIADELPNLDPYFKPRLWWPIVYSPDLEWVAYYSYSARKQGGLPNEGPSVYNVKTKQMLWDTGNGVASDPVWSPNGQVLAFTGGMDEYQLYLFSLSGQVKAVLDDSLPHDARAFSWSPNGRYIAFWNAESLMVYDLDRDWLFDTCISSSSTSSSPVWSPDNQQFIINQSSAQPLLIDWQKQAVYKIKYTQDSIIFGWMNSIP